MCVCMCPCVHEGVLKCVLMCVNVAAYIPAQCYTTSTTFFLCYMYHCYLCVEDLCDVFCISGFGWCEGEVCVRDVEGGRGELGGDVVRRRRGREWGRWFEGVGFGDIF